MNRILILLLITNVLFSGCSANDTNHDIFQYKGSFVGDNSAVGNITNQLLGAEQLNGFELKTDEEPYGIVLNYDGIESKQAYKDLVIYNATYLFTLVQNVDWITFLSEFSDYTITKDNLQNWYQKELHEVQNEENLRELIEKYVEDENKVNELLN